MSRVDEALALFKEGFSCSQAVFAVNAKDLGLDYEMALKLSQGFGAGMGGMRGECGCLTGAYMVVGLLYGRTKADDNAARVKTFRLVKEVSKRFKETHDTTACGQLLQNKSGTHFEMCGDYVKLVCEILEELVGEDL